MQTITNQLINPQLLNIDDEMSHSPTSPNLRSPPLEDHEMHSASAVDQMKTPTGPAPITGIHSTATDPKTFRFHTIPPGSDGKENRPPLANAWNTNPKLTPRFTIRIPPPPSRTYANVLKRNADQVGTNSPEYDPYAMTNYYQYTSGYDSDLDPDPIPSPGPIKGFDTNKILMNLDPVLRREWESQLNDGAILVYHLNGGYAPTIAQKVSRITNDLEILYDKSFLGEHLIEPAVVYPTAATPDLHNHFAAPYLFLVTDIPRDFANWLVKKAIHPVQSDLRVLFALNGDPAPCDYLMTITNYNLPTDNDYQKDWAKTIVHRSVVRTLFDEQSPVMEKVAKFISQFRDNIPPHLSESGAFSFIRESTKVEILEVFVPGTGILTPVYNVYIHPPTRLVDCAKRWKTWIENQRFYAGRYGVGMKYKYGFNCNHCKTTDHPSGLCPHIATVAPPTATNDNNPEDDIFPLNNASASTSTPPHQSANPGPSRNRGKDSKGKERALNPPNDRAGPRQGKASTSRASAKKRRMK